MPRLSAARGEYGAHRVGNVAHLGTGERTFRPQQPVQRRQVIVRDRRIQVMLEVMLA